MTLEFKESEMSLYEGNTPLMGYFEPGGEFINLSCIIDTPCHDGDNTLSPAYEFINWVSYVIKEADYKTFDNTNDIKNLNNEIIKHGYEGYFGYTSSSMEDFKKELNVEIEKQKKYLMEHASTKNIKTRSFLIEKWEYNMLLFFKNAYSKNSFFKAINREIKIDNPEEIFKKFDNHSLINIYNDYTLAYAFYTKKTLLKDHFKDICVQYLGYDSLERFSPDGNIIKPPYRELLVPKGPTNFQKTPRIITTSSPNQNERFYNYLLMNWNIHRLPRYMFNEKTGIYEKDKDYLNYYFNDKEKIYEEEIKSIKKLVPLKERYKYFR